MQFKNFKEVNQTIGAGDNTNTNDLALSLCIDPNYQDGQIHHSLVTCFEVAEEDLKRISETGVIWVTIAGMGMPPIRVISENPFNDLGLRPIHLPHNYVSEPPNANNPCVVCEGSGILEVHDSNLDSGIRKTPCHACKGTGEN